MGKYKVVFSNTYHQERVQSTSLLSVVPPLDLAYCASVVRTLGTEIDVQIIDANALKMNVSMLADKLISMNPDLVVFSSKTHSINAVKELSSRIKKKKKKVNILLIGNHASAMPKQTMEELSSLDFIIVGEAEYVIKNLVNSLIGKKKLSKVTGLVYRDAKKIVMSKKQDNPVILNELPFPARDLLPNKLYSSPYSSRVTGIETSRGCPGKCTYCEIHHVDGYNTRFRDPVKVVEEIEHCVQKYHTNYFAIMDHTFTINQSYVQDICKELIRKGLGKKIIWSCNTRLDMLDKKSLKLMKKAGCIQIGVGIEVGDSQRLMNIRKGINPQKIRVGIAEIKKQGIICMGYTIIGFPDETKQEILQTEKVIHKYNPHVIQISFATPLPGTELYTQCKKKGILLSDDWDDYLFLKKPIIKNEYMSSSEIVSLRDSILRRFYMRPWKIISLTRIFLLNPNIEYSRAIRTFFKINKFLKK